MESLRSARSTGSASSAALRNPKRAPDRSGTAALCLATAWVGPSARESPPSAGANDDPNVKDAAAKAAQGDQPPATEAARDHAHAAPVDIDGRLAQGDAARMAQPNGHRSTPTGARARQRDHPARRQV